MKVSMKSCAVVTTCVAVMLVTSCGGGNTSTSTTSASSTSNSYVGTQTAGDFWTWVMTTQNSSETFAAANTTLGYSYSGSATVLSGNAAGFTKLVVTNSSDSSVSAGATAYQIEIPGTALVSMPGPWQQLATGDTTGYVNYYGSNVPPVVSIVKGSCPTSGGTFNWVLIPPQTWCSGADTRTGSACPSNTTVGAAYGTAAISVTNGAYDLAVQPYKLNGDPKSAFSMSGALCSNGVITGTDSNGRALNIAFTPNGLFFIDLPSGAGSIIGADASTSISTSDLLKDGNAFIGTVFTSIKNCYTAGGIACTASATAPDTRAIYLTTSSGTSMTGQFFLDLDSGTLQSDSDLTSTLTIVDDQTTSPGLIRYSVSDAKGTQSATFVVKQISGKYYIFGIADHWNGSSGMTEVGEMAGRNIIAIQAK